MDTSHTNDATTVYLTLQLLPGNEVSVTFGNLPSSSMDMSGDEKRQLKFPLGQHVNLDGFQAAKTNGGVVSPLLFYVSFPNLLLNFSSTFGVFSATITGQGNMNRSPSSSLGMPTKSEVMRHMQHSIPMTSTAEKSRADFDATLPTIPGRPAVDIHTHNDPLRVMDSHMRGKHNRGDFESDLLPGGPNQPGGLHQMPPRGMGSQVGPNHPMFDRTFGEDRYNNGHDDEFGGGFGNEGGSFGVPGVGGGMGMRPRFDPYGPPGGPTDPGRGGRGNRLGSGRGGQGGRGRGRMPPPGGFGNPNPDHMTPPGGGYFS